MEGDWGEDDEGLATWELLLSMLREAWAERLARDAWEGEGGFCNPLAKSRRLAA